MSIFNFFLKSKNSKLQERVDLLEKQVLELSKNLRVLSSLALQTGIELENVLSYIDNRSAPTSNFHNASPDDDFYN